MGQYRFVSNRSVKNKAGQDAGNMRVIVRQGSEKAEVSYRCPECQNSESLQTPWVRPFSVTCSKCKFVIKLPKLKEEIKKEKAAAKKATEAKLMKEAGAQV